jgi:trehalose-6-phosphatase
MVDKATAARAILRDLQQQPEEDFVLCIGDGKTDEVVFSMLSEVEGAITSTVGKKQVGWQETSCPYQTGTDFPFRAIPQTEAKYYLDTVGDVERLLEKLNAETTSS